LPPAAVRSIVNGLLDNPGVWVNVRQRLCSERALPEAGNGLWAAAAEGTARGNKARGTVVEIGGHRCRGGGRKAIRAAQAAPRVRACLPRLTVVVRRRRVEKDGGAEPILVGHIPPATGRPVRRALRINGRAAADIGVPGGHLGALLESLRRIRAGSVRCETLRHQNGRTIGKVRHNAGTTQQRYRKGQRDGRRQPAAI